jgi:hypothetical protein
MEYLDFAMEYEDIVRGSRERPAVANEFSTEISRASMNVT